MGKKRDMTTKTIIVAFYKEGMSQTEIANKANCSQGTVSKVIKKYKNIGDTCIATRGYKNRLRKTTPMADKSLRRIVNNGRYKTVSEITETWKNISGVSISPTTTLRRLGEMGYKSKNTKKRPLLTTKQKAKSLNGSKIMKIGHVKIVGISFGLMSPGSVSHLEMEDQRSGENLEKNYYQDAPYQQ